MYDVSVIIPSHNRSKLLKKTLQLLNEQTYPRHKFEAIVVDDGSADDTEKTVREFQSTVGYKLKYMSQAQRGPGSARNRGIKESESDFVLFIGDDIFPAKNLIERHITSLRQYPEAAVLGLVDWSKECEVTDFMHYVAPNGFQFRYNTIKNPEDCDFKHFYTSNISLAKKWLMEELFDEGFPYGALEDAELSYRLKKKGLRIIFNNEAIGYHFHPMTLESFCHRMRLTGISAVMMLKKHPELKSILLPVNGTAAGIIFSILVRTAFIKKINRKFYWYCRIVSSYLEGIKEGSLVKKTIP
jgi:glycosyltransferase involved in cell wall biosynthesis